MILNLRHGWSSDRDSIRRVGELAAEVGSQRTLVVTDPGIVAAGHVAVAIESLKEHGIATEFFDGATENPTTHDVESGLHVAREFKPDLLIGLGGGSSMDCAKGINFVYSCGGNMKDYWGVGKATAPMLPMIAIPTTTGTGSEMQSFALISDAETHVKMACGDKKASCRIAILDPTANADTAASRYRVNRNRRHLSRGGNVGHEKAKSDLDALVSRSVETIGR